MRAWRGKRANGFALITVIWGLGIISLLVVSFMTTGRLRLQAANNVAGAAQAAAVVDGATNLTIMQLLSERDTRLGQAATGAQVGGARAVHEGAPRFCQFGAAAVALAVEEESGKIDLNAASPDMLKAVLLGLGEDRTRADALAMSIVAFRTQQDALTQRGAASGSGDRPFGPKNALFQTVLELDQVEGVTPALFRRLTPLTTVYSRNPGVNPLASPPALFAALVGLKADEVDALLHAPFPNGLDRKDPRFPAQFKGGASEETFLIRVEALFPNGQAAGRETIIDFSVGLTAALGGAGGAYAVKEVHRAPSRYSDVLRGALTEGGLQPC